MAEVARLFLAAPLGEEVRQAMARRLLEMVPVGLPGRRVPPENWHVTLRFLGGVDPVGTDRLLAAMDSGTLGPIFRVRWGSLGAFPRPAKATVLWVGMAAGAEESSALAAAVEARVGAAGLPPEERPFRPHLTLSRIRPPQDVAALLESVPSMGVGMQVDRVVLYRSHLGRGGARYEAVEEFSLD